MLFLLCRNSNLHKFRQLFDWKWVNKQEFIRGSFSHTKFHCFGLRNISFLKIFGSVLCFFLHENSDSRKFVQLFDSKWVNEQGYIGGSSFLGQIPSFPRPKWHFFKKNLFWYLFFFFGFRIQFHANLFSFSIGNGSTSRTP